MHEDPRRVAGLNRRWILGLAAVLACGAFVSVTAPAWAQPASQIVYVAPADNQLHLADASGTELGSLGLFGSTPKWSPDGTRIAYFDIDGGGPGSHVHIAIYTTAGTGSTVRLSDPAGGEFSYDNFCWSPDSASILHLFDVSNLALIPEWWVTVPARAYSESAPKVTFGMPTFVRTAAPTPDGMYAVIEQPYTFAALPDGSQYRMIGTSRMAIMDTAGHTWKSAPVASLGIGNVADPDVSADGSKVVFAGYTTFTSSNIYVWNLASNTVTTLYSGSDEYNLCPKFTADGASVIWSRRSNVGATVPDTWIVSTSGSDPHLLIASTREADPQPPALLPKATVSTPSASSSARRGRSFTVTGYVAPRHTSGTYVATLYCYRLEGGDWVLKKTVKARRSALSSTRSKYSASVSLPTTGSWRIRAFHLDAGHRGSWSGNRAVTVK